LVIYSVARGGSMVHTPRNPSRESGSDSLNMAVALILRDGEQRDKT
jgi:hypothetical protein